MSKLWRIIMSILSKIFKKISTKSVLNTAKEVILTDVITGKTDNIVKDILNKEKEILIASTISEFVLSVERKEYEKVIQSLYVDINYVKGMINANPEKAMAKVNYILKELDDACKVFKDEKSQS